MGQKTHPKGLRIGINEEWDSKWLFTKRKIADFIVEDYLIRRYIKNRFEKGSISKIEIERKAEGEVIITIYTARPGIIIGRKGILIDRLMDELGLILKKKVNINIQEIRESDLDAGLVAESIARQIEQKVSYRRAMKKAIANTMKAGAKGIKVLCKGRLMGAALARKEWYKEGRIPLHTYKAKIDYAYRIARTKFGTIGVKVWIYIGDEG
jgi:small subunit ribosomal protein S3